MRSLFRVEVAEVEARESTLLHMPPDGLKVTGEQHFDPKLGEHSFMGRLFRSPTEILRDENESRSELIGN